jgi:hypothetical protein
MKPRNYLHKNLIRTYKNSIKTLNSFIYLQRQTRDHACTCELENKKMETRLLGQVSAVDIQILARIL